MYLLFTGLLGASVSSHGLRPSRRADGRWWDTFSLVLRAGFLKLCTKMNVNVTDVD